MSHTDEFGVIWKPDHVNPHNGFRISNSSDPNSVIAMLDAKMNKSGHLSQKDVLIRDKAIKMIATKKTVKTVQSGAGKDFIK